MMSEIIRLHTTASEDAINGVQSYRARQLAEPPPKSLNAGFVSPWIWEVTALGIAIGLVAAIFSILGHFNGRVLPNWPLRINLNTLIALLSTIMRALLLISMAAVISQSKWLWYGRDRPLHHFRNFDEASRGVLGSFRLLFTAPKSVYGTMGALITILSLAIGPFTQQAVNTVPCVQNLTVTVPSIPIAHFAPGTAENSSLLFDVHRFSDPPLQTMAVLTNGMISDSTITPACPTGDCIFRPDSQGVTHSSIAMCSTCIDTTPLVSVRHGNFTLPNQWVFLTTGYGKLVDVRYDQNLSWASSLFTDEFRAISSRFWTYFTVLTLSSTWCVGNTTTYRCPVDAVPPVEDASQMIRGVAAVSCVLYPCLKNYKAKVTLGSLNEKLISSIPAMGDWNERAPDWVGSPLGTDQDPRPNYTAVRTPCIIDNTEYDAESLDNIPRVPGHQFVQVNTSDNRSYAAPAECVYRMDYEYAYKINVFIENSLMSEGSYCGVNTGTPTGWWNATILCGVNDQKGNLVPGNRWWLAPLWNGGVATPQSLSSSAEKLATAVTNHIRTTGGQIHNYENIQREWAYGVAQQTTVCAVFQWQWLLMPLGLLILGSGLIIAIIIHSLRTGPWGQRIWKTSVLPFLFYRIDDYPWKQVDPRPAMGLGEMEDLAKNIRVRFRNGSDAGFVLAEMRDMDVDSLLETEQYELQSR